MITLSHFSNSHGRAVGKSYRCVDGAPFKYAPDKKPFADQCKVMSFSTAKELGVFIMGLESSSHLVAGIPRADGVDHRVATKARKVAGFITRSKEDIVFPDGGGIGLVDHDFNQQAPEHLRMDQLRLRTTLSNVLGLDFTSFGIVGYPSSSSYIELADGSECRGLRGHHMLWLLKEPADWGRALDCIHKRLVIAGFGYAMITASGGQLIRSACDAVVGADPSRAIYSAPASLGDGLRISPDRTGWFNEGPPLDTRAAIPPLTLDEQADYDVAIAGLLAASAEQAAEVKAAYDAARIRSAVERGVSVPQAQASCASARVGRLEGGWEIQIRGGVTVTVDDILDKPARYHCMDCCDPLEPEYNSSALCARIYTDRDGVFVSSLAHGGDGSGLRPKVYVLGRSIADTFEDLTAPSAGVTPTLPPEDSKTPATRFVLRTGTALSNLPPMRWLLRGVLPKDGLGVLYGPSGSGKSFLALDAAAAIAGGADRWFGLRVTQCPVVYVCLEGEAGMGKRISAWSKHYGKPVPSDLHFITEQFDLLKQGDVVALAKSIRDGGGGGGLVIIDTLSRAAPGADENSSVDMGLIIAAGQQLQVYIGGLVLLVHHTGKDATKGMRGHSNLYAALDGAIEVTKTDTRSQWSVAKSKDDETGIAHSFKLVVVPLGLDDDQEEVTSCVAVANVDGHAAHRVKLPVGGNQKIAMDALSVAFGASQDFGMAGSPDGQPCVRIDAGVALIADRMVCDQKRKVQRAREALTGLLSRTVYGSQGDWMWRT